MRRAGDDNKQRLRPETCDYLMELAHEMSAHDFRRHRRFRPVPLAVVVDLHRVLLDERAALPRDEDGAARLDLLLRLLDQRSPRIAPALRASVRERALRPATTAATRHAHAAHEREEAAP